MAKRIHFEDDIFYLNLIVRSVRDGLALELDPELFLPRLVDDLRFLDATLRALLEELQSNARLIERNEQFRNLSETEERFSSLLIQFQNSALVDPEDDQPLLSLLAELLSDSRKRRMQIDNETDFNTLNDADPAVVSSLELNELLKFGQD